MNKKIERVIEHLEHLKVKDIELYNSLDKNENNQVVSFGKIQGLNDALNFIKSEFS